MATWLVHSIGEARSASGVRGAVVNAVDAATARVRANTIRTSGSDPNFADASQYAVNQQNSTDSTYEFLIEGNPLLLTLGHARRG